MINTDDYLHLDQARLAALSPAERFRVLGDLAETAGAWIRDQRSTHVEQLRRELGLDDAGLAAHLGVTQPAVADLGDGPMTADGVRPRLLRRTAEKLLTYAQGVQVEQLSTALTVLSKRGRPVLADHMAAARRITIVAKGLAGALGDMSSAERAVCARGVAHAAEVEQGRQWNPSSGS